MKIEIFKKFCDFYGKKRSRFYTVSDNYSGASFIFPSIAHLAQEILHKVRCEHKDTLYIDKNGAIASNIHGEMGFNIYDENETLEALEEGEDIITFLQTFENFEKYKKHFEKIFVKNKKKLTPPEDMIADSVWSKEMTGEFWTEHDEESLTRILKEKRKEQKLCWLSNKKIEKIVATLLEWMHDEIEAAAKEQH